MNRHIFWLSAILFSIGAGIFAYKSIVLHFPLQPDTSSELWTIEANVSFLAKPSKPVKVTLLIPRSDRRNLLLDENFISRGFGLTSEQKGFNRQATWAIRSSSGQQQLFYRAVVRKVTQEESSLALPPAKIPERNFEDDAYIEAAQAILDEVRERSADTETFVGTLFSFLSDRKDDNSNVRLLLGKNPDKKKILTVAAQMLRQHGIRARTVHGIRLYQSARHVPLEHWLEIYEDGKWSFYKRPEYENSDEEPLFVWSRGDDPMTEIEGGSNVQFNISVKRSEESSIRSAVIQTQARRPVLFEFSTFALPLHVQAVYRLLLLIPIGAFMIVLIRSIIGLRTFGTFMPVLIGLSFRETQLVAGIILFSLITCLSLAVRLYFERLKLLLVARLGAILMVVVFLMLCVSLVTFQLGIPTGLSVALFPIVIMTIAVERMSVIWEEVGPAEAFKQGFGTLVAASVIYFVMTFKTIEHLMFVFPELILVLLSFTILLGRYTGYRLVEFGRFKSMVEN